MDKTNKPMIITSISNKGVVSTTVASTPLQNTTPKHNLNIHIQKEK